ncbi:DUF167 domain-containing protein [Aeromicrobium sp. A1-2]|uniref:DUF167 domain-containing protein n=1 Tax=Aeromicrobium sp. A1-2 TaxID=2107713 RepID=UPI001C1F4A28|nr:DUF167 domain-containing protein [Aeromicrobium sp. A1-2]
MGDRSIGRTAAAGADRRAPVDGKANTALRDFLATSLGLSKSKVVLEKGGTSRFKTFEIPDGTELP